MLLSFEYFNVLGLSSTGLVSEYTSQREKGTIPVNRARILF